MRIFFILFLSTIFSRFAQSAVLEPASYGILLKYKTLSKQMDSFHKKKRTVIVKRFIGLPPNGYKIDHVVPAEPDLVSNTRFLKFLCKSYRRTVPTAHCEVNFAISKKQDHSKDATQPIPPTPIDRTPEAKSAVCKLYTSPSSSPIYEGTLSPYWAQEQTGAADIEELIAEDFNAADPAKNKTPAPVGVFDSGFVPSKLHRSKEGVFPDDLPYEFDPKFPIKESEAKWWHGSVVSNTINAPYPAGTSPRTEINFMHPVKFADGFAEGLEKFSNAEQHPKIINVSMTLGNNSEVAFGALSELASESILVGAAGNDWPKPLPRNESTLNGIFVGSQYPQGYICHDSQEGENVAITAPSDGLLTSSFDGHPVPFGGTSGAAPQVTAALSLAMAYLPNLDVEEAKLLLQRTALRTSVTLQKPKKNGAGMLNVAGLVMLAKDFQQRGLNRDSRMQELQNGLGTTSKQHQELASKQALKTAFELLNLEDTSENCTQRARGFSLLRLSYNLNPNEPARNRLISEYRRQGLTTNAEFYENMDEASLSKNLAKDVESPHDILRLSVARAASFMKEKGEPHLMRLLALSDDPPPRSTAFTMPTFTNHLGWRSVAEAVRTEYPLTEKQKFAERAAKSPRPATRIAALKLAEVLGLGKATIVRPLLKDTDSEVQLAALNNVAEIGNTQNAINQIRSVMDGSPEKNRKEMALALVQVPNTELRNKARDMLLNDPDKEIRIIAATGFDFIERAVFDRVIKKETDEAVLKKLVEQGAYNGYIGAVLPLISHASPDIRKEVLFSLRSTFGRGDTTDAKIASALSAGLKDTDRTVRLAAAEAFLVQESEAIRKDQASERLAVIEFMETWKTEPEKIDFHYMHIGPVLDKYANYPTWSKYRKTLQDMSTAVKTDPRTPANY